ncbi:MAG: S8 family serine peptidase [Deltaproteobacteria bacterium]|nr:S8 family serine peptidase [Deltaproteobacteria bacterium]
MRRATSGPRIFFLNEQHELTPEKRGGGGPPTRLEVDWARKGAALRGSLRAAVGEPAPTDPTSSAHHYLTVFPDLTLTYLGKERGADVDKPKAVSFGGDEGRALIRLGFDLLGQDGGAAYVHLSADNLARLDNTIERIAEQSRKEQTWLAMLERFAPIPIEKRLHPAVVEGRERVDVIVELMPVLRGPEPELVVQAMRRFFREREVEVAWRRLGRDPSRRVWVRLVIAARHLAPLVEAFPAIQRVHEPLRWWPAGRTRKPTAARALAAPPPVPAAMEPPRLDVRRAPIVGVVDLGIPEGHPVLDGSVVKGRYRDPEVVAHRGDHGSAVASRIVFPGLREPPRGGSPPGPRCEVVDLNVADRDGDVAVVSGVHSALFAECVDVKAVIPRMTTALDANPDLRVFNLSLGSEASLTTLAVSRPDLYQEELRALAELDNFAHRRDVLLVVPMGNAPLGAVPSKPYPDHGADPLWHATVPGAGANVVTVGSTVGEHVDHPDAAVEVAHWPSPFARLGVMPLDTRKPDFAAVGGNQPRAGTPGPPSPWLRVPILDQRGDWDSGAGTSYAAPVVSRAAAFLLRRLADLGEAQPFAVTLKACLALTAKPCVSSVPPATRRLFERATGHGYVDVEPWFRPRAEHALFVWQGVLGAPQVATRVQVPVPRAWLTAAAQPVVRVAWAWDPPVTAEQPELWICRDVKLQLRVRADQAALLPATRGGGPYPLRVREYTLAHDALTEKYGTLPESDLWVVDLTYSVEAELPDPTLSSNQRVALALELVDRGSASSPQPFVEALPLAATMSRLRVQSTVPVRVPT